MNPLQWLKAVYETFGTPYPRASLAAVAFLGAICFVAVWLFAAKQVEKDRQTSSAPMSGPASTTGDNSPANTGGGNQFQYDQSTHSQKKPKPQK
jgi:hypothetical protein